MNVELRPAFGWDCPDCDQENFARAIVPEFSNEEIKELNDDHGVQPWEVGEFMMQPKYVKCCHCHAKFESVYYKEA